MLTIINSISRLNGVLSTRSIIKHNAITLITGKILEESLTSSTTMLTNYVKTGKLAPS